MSTVWVHNDVSFPKITITFSNIFSFSRFHILPLHLKATDSKRDAGITVAARPMDEICETAFSLIKSNKEGRIIKFAEKPK
jgi:hypothetical protein